MGMFDWVKVNMDCPYCKESISDSKVFQSKDGECYLQEIYLNDLISFYGKCPHCKKWIEYERDSVRKNKFDPSGWKLIDRPEFNIQTYDLNKTSNKKGKIVYKKLI